jgi:hypothetical protein
MLPGLGALSAMAVFDRQGQALQDRFTARRDNTADTARLRAEVPRIADAEALLKDRRTLRLVLESFQLESEIDKRALLRRVLTEDPADQRSIANRLTDPRWRALASAFATVRPVALTPAEVARQTPEQLRGLQLNAMAGLTAQQVQALSATQVAALDPAQLAAIAPDAIGALDTTDVTALSAGQVAALTPAQLARLDSARIAVIEPADLAAVTPDRLRALSPPQVAALTAAQLAALRPAQLGAFSAQQAAALSATQREALGATGRTILDRAQPAPAADPAALTPQRPPLDDRVLLDRIVQGAMVNRFEKSMGEANPGLREALYFRRMAGTATSVNALMADRVLLEVMRGALGLPQQFGLLPFERQRDIIAQRLDVRDLQDPAKVARLASRYLAQQPAASSAAPALALFQGGGAAGLVASIGRRVSLSA